MNRTSMNAAARAALVSFSILGAAFVSGGCVYRPNIQQGNLLEVEDVEQVTAGMTRSQVRYLLGTPMLADPFDPQRWDYIYTFRRGRGSKIDRSHFVVHFDGDKVGKVEKLDLPDGANDPKKKKKQASSNATREPPTLPSIDQPQPDAPRPGSDS